MCKQGKHFHRKYS